MWATGLVANGGKRSIIGEWCGVVVVCGPPVWWPTAARKVSSVSDVVCGRWSGGLWLQEEHHRLVMWCDVVWCVAAGLVAYGGKKSIIGECCGVV